MHAPEDIRSTKRALAASMARLFVPALLLVTAILIGILYTVYKAEYEKALLDLKQDETTAIELQSNRITRIFVLIVGDLTFLTQENELLDLAELTGQPQLLETTAALAKEYLALARSRTVYDQIRFIDRTGMERARVDFNNGNPIIIPPQQLQNKSDRYYFQESISLPRGDIYLSPLDLNVEGKEIERPFKPMIRFAAPVFSRKDALLGIVVLNYRAQSLLNAVAAGHDSPMREKMLVNGNGYWLLNPDPEQEWGFMLPERKDHTFGAMYPEEWRTMQEQSSGQIMTPDGLFTFARVNPPEEALEFARDIRPQEDPLTGRAYRRVYESRNNYHWILINHVPPKVVAATTGSLKNNFMILGIVLLILSALLAFFFSIFLVKRRMYREKLISMAQYDNLTGLPNRRLFFDRLDMVVRNAARKHEKFGLLYIDLDGFKGVNDTMGHHAGDELLVLVSRAMDKCLRKSDTVARLGGDEFAVILPSINNGQEATEVAQKILVRLKAPLDLSAGQAHIGASIGVVVYPDHAVGGDQLIELADQAMYSAKKGGRNTIVLFTEPSVA